MNKSLSFSNFADDAHTLTNSFSLGGAALRRAAVMEATELAGHVSAGVIAGTVVEATLYPIDTIKTRLQAARGGASVMEAAKATFPRMGAELKASFSLPSFYDNFTDGEISNRALASALQSAINSL